MTRTAHRRGSRRKFGDEVQAWTRNAAIVSVGAVPAGEFMRSRIYAALTPRHKPTRPPRNAYSRPLIRDRGIKGVSITRAGAIKGTPVINVSGARARAHKHRVAFRCSGASGISCIAIDSFARARANVGRDRTSWRDAMRRDAARSL